MFSISPFIIDYQRPKSYALFDDDYYPFSRNRYYIGQQAPSPFGRSFSFRAPSSYQQCPASFQLKPERPRSIESDEEPNDPFLDLFGLRSQCKAAKRKDSNRTCGQPSKETKPELRKEANRAPQEEPQASPKKLKSSEEKVLDSQRFDTDNEIEFRFSNYRCNDPAGIDVRITKENYVELRTADGYVWKSRLSDNVGDLQKATCTLSNGVLSLKLPKRAQAEQQTSGKEASEAKEPKKVEESAAEKVEEKTEEKMDEEFDPDAPIVEDIVEEMN